ncbi:MAG: peptide-methionine (R)-S-oxide reductase MsrB [Candidatus Kaiserbacteria bacterium]|nr:peptide-methionine (R)-S-oxide reductase MsrB [Candidatus Kaiserbacteria bacterium]
MEEDNKKELRERLSEEAYQVTQEGATEPPFTGEYYKTKDDGMYHCAVCGTELFDAGTKFDSGTGWPSFYDTTGTDTLRLSPDESQEMVRTEVSCRKCGAHLGHVFEDAPNTPTGQRYCINSCALSLNKKEKDATNE